MSSGRFELKWMGKQGFASKAGARSAVPDVSIVMAGGGVVFFQDGAQQLTGNLTREESRE